ncbi:sphingomyelin phosphodiesterase [Leptospira noguchii]|uniref:sphingomyelin phosphodiesterase n=1 Tax=Leptospira noguchii TaxID=28182 RepID=UPI001FB7C3B2|nr:sphingomyelin phosphodiesterase [Leptospira noguchii]UOG33532.1 sphingomyelin phosphodiesterase [Leptospira noguchii]UOG44370.1 sphingomyelin phosphodiesterase [Leptospira noguchii]
MKLKRNIVRKKSIETEIGRILVCCFFLFFLNCLPDRHSSSNNNLLLSLLFSEDPINVGSRSTSAERMGSTKSDPTNNDELGVKILNYNLSMPSTKYFTTKHWGQEERAKLLLNSQHIQLQDVIVLEGVVNENSQKILSDGLRYQYPYQTSVLGAGRENWNNTLGGDFFGTSWLRDNGGIMILSKWPIEEKIQYIYENGMGRSYFPQPVQGFLYVKLNKHGQLIHVIGARVISGNFSTLSHLPAKDIRKTQYSEIKNFINMKDISKNEMVFIVGNFGTEKGSNEYKEMLSILRVNEPHYVGISKIWDPKKNPFAAYFQQIGSHQKLNYPNYVFVSSDHSQPPVWQNLAYDPTSKKYWKTKAYQSDEYSDYYPVYGFVYADSLTPTFSTHKKKYDRVSLEAIVTNKKIQADPKNRYGWLKVNTTEETPYTTFNLYQEGAEPNCIQSGRIRIEVSEELNYFWNYWLKGGAGNYAYYTNWNVGSDLLEVINLDKNSCLEDGIQIAFKDYDIITQGYYILTNWMSGSWGEYIFLWKDYIGPMESFYLRLDKTPAQNWKKDLIYR